MSLITTDDNYNADTRWLEQKAVIHFSSSNTLDITKDNYLISSNVLEEMHAQSGTIPFGNITSNELTLDLLNENGIFNPSNNQSPYYGLMKKGIKIELFIRPVVESEDLELQYEWDPMGVYYVSDWQAKVTGLISTITANDQLYSTDGKDLTILPVCRNMTQQEFYQHIFDNLGLSVEIDNTLLGIIKYAYINKGTKELLSELNTSALADCFCKHDGHIVVQHLTNLKDTRAQITDANQIINADIQQTIISSYDDVNVTYNLPQESDVQNVLSLKDVTIPAGISSRKNILLTGTPLLKLSYSLIHGVLARITDMSATPISIDITTNNEGETTDNCSIDIFGTILMNNEVSIGSATDKSLLLSNMYIQDSDYAKNMYNHLSTYITNKLPILELEVRGNPKLELGEVIQVDSDKYNLHYTGLLIRQTFDYDGSLKGTMTLLNISILQEV